MTEHITTDIRFSIVPHWLIDLKVSDRALRLYAVLAKFADSETGQAFPGRTRLSKELDCSLKSVDRAVAELIEVGAVRKVQRVNDGHYQSSLYTVMRAIPAPVVTQPRVTDDATPRQGSPDPVSPVTHITRPTELEPLKQEPLSKVSPKNADEYEPSTRIIESFDSEWPGLRYDIELQKFRDHHTAKGSKFKDWDRAFQGWLRRASEWSPEAKKARAWAEWEKQVSQLEEEENATE